MVSPGDFTNVCFGLSADILPQIVPQAANRHQRTPHWVWTASGLTLTVAWLQTLAIVRLFKLTPDEVKRLTRTKNCDTHHTLRVSYPSIAPQVNCGARQPSVDANPEVGAI
jgi:hypothetical protein